MTEQPRIDPTVIDELIDLGPETGLQLVKDLIGLFNSEAPMRLSAMRESLANGDWKGVGQAAHAMRGGAGNLGAVVVGELCTRIEQVAKTGNAAAIAPLIDQLDREMIHVQDALAARLVEME